MELLRILFVEDLPTDYELAQWYLRKDDLSFDSICVDTKQEFINALDEFQPELIISDYSMPEFNGLQALQITLENHPDIPFIVLTGSINEETAVQCMRAGAADYVLKEKMHRLPFSVRETLKRDKERKERIVAENQLRVSEEKFRDIFESANVGKAITSTTETIAVNDAFADMLGYTKEELIKISWEELTHPDDYPYTREKVDALHRGEVDAVRYEKRYFHRDGHPVWVDISAKTHRDSVGKVEYFFSTIIDITEKKKAEEKLQESETRFRMLFDQAPVGYQSLDKEGKFIDVNSTWLELIGYEREEVIGKWFGDFLAQSCLDTHKECFARFLKEGSIKTEFEMIKKDRSIIHVAFEGRIGYDGQGEFKQTHCIMQDITESKKAEIARKESEKRYRHLFEDSPVAIFEEDFSAAKKYINALRDEKEVTDFREYFTSHPEDLSNIVGLVKVTDVNQASLLLYGADNKEELLSELKKEVPIEDSFVFMDEIVNVANGLTHFYYETSLIDLKGRTHFLAINWAATPGYADDLSKVILTLIDITEQKEAEQAIRESEERYRSLFEDSPVSIWEEDFTEVKKHLDELKAAGIEDFEEYFSKNQSELLKFADLIVVNDVNQETVRLFGANDKDELRNNFRNIYTEKSLEQLKEELVNIAEGKSHFDIDFINKTLDGDILEFSAKWAVVPGFEDNFSKVLISMIDITDRKKAENALRENEQRYRSLFNDSPVAIFEENFSAVKNRIDELKQSGVKNFREFLNANPDELRQLIRLIEITDINNEAEKLYGFKSRINFTGDIEQVATPFNIYLMIDELVNISDGLTKFQTEVYKPDSQGNRSYLSVNWAAVPGYEENLSKVIVTVVDITERKELEKRQQERLAEMEAMDKITTVLREARSKEEALPIFLQETLAMIQVKMGSIWLYQKESDSLQISNAIGCGEDLPSIEVKPGEGIVGKVFLEGKTFYSSEFIMENLHPCFAEHISKGVGGVCVPIQSQEDELGVILIIYPKDREIKTDEVKLLEAFARIAGITLQRMTLYEDTLSHLKQLQVQRSIDQTIASIFDLNLVLDIISSQTLNYLRADATGILLFHPNELILTFVTGNGFRTNQYKNTRIPLGAGPAGKAALSREIIPVKNILQGDPPFKSMNFLNEERFVSYLAVPLIAKGELKGVLEVFYRAETDFKEDLLGFVESLAFQTAIAIDNLQLFENLQRSNQELIQAYDATIEGWSRAMDLRDKETENHTIRVTEMAVRISRIMGVQEEEIVHIRRGALLHDIGKIGVPDGILHKPGPLTPEEWVIMKQHPIFAYEMIAPVDYLKPALDIPYCHHEKWDGSGYPRGLKGTEIPIAGRIFAVVDVWDALSSDRPYRKAWPKDKVLDYIKEQSGAHFDPEIVKIFLEVIESEDWLDE